MTEKSVKISGKSDPSGALKTAKEITKMQTRFDWVVHDGLKKVQ
jgi:hypothetical protein